MKNICYLLTLMILFSCKENSSNNSGSMVQQDTTSVSNPPEDSLQKVLELNGIEDIRLEHTYISSKIESGSLDSISFKYNCREEKKGELIYYSEEGQLRLIKHIYNEYSHFSATDQYFLKDGEIFFVFKEHLAWSFVDQNQTKDEIIEKRFYIINKEPVQCLEKQYTVLSNDPNAPNSNIVPNRETECSSLQPLYKEFELLFNLRNQKDDMACLQD